MMRALILAAALTASLFVTAVLFEFLWSLPSGGPNEMYGIGAVAGGLSRRFITMVVLLVPVVFVAVYVLARKQQQRAAGKRGRDV